MSQKYQSEPPQGANTVIIHCRQRASLYALAFMSFVAACGGPLNAAPKAKPVVAANAIAGQVKGANGPEAGVWVIAETSDLPTKYAKMVVTDDLGRFVIPELPSAKYKIWVRG